MRISVTVLCDNLVTTRGLLAEHGLALLLERGEEQLLFDAGQSICALHKASLLDVGLRCPPIVLSHGHYDHTDGLASFLRAFGDTVVLAHPDIFRERLSKVRGEEVRSIGMSLSEEALMRRGARFHLRDGPQEARRNMDNRAYQSSLPRRSSP
jgi:7,8-dihydropterin-6-yl-methyl-4-(beta-D-ribofuranosyl)aminobenzene 5'-phosphate synthase